MHQSLQSHKFNLIIDVLILMLLLYVPRDSSFILAQFLVLNLDGWFVVYNYIYIYIYIYISYSFVSELYCSDICEVLAPLSGILFATKSSVPLAVFFESLILKRFQLHRYQIV